MSFTKKTILVVDGNKTIVLYMGIMLKRMGFNVVPADSGVEALRLMKLVTPDMVLMDSGMPSTEGFDTLVQIRRDERGRDVPVVMMTAHDDEGFIGKCTGAGCSGFLPKPVPMEMLHEHIQDFIFAPLGFKRKHLRAQVDLKVMLAFDGSYREYHTETVSEGGVYVKTESPLKVGTSVSVIIPRDAGNLSLEGAVIYVKATPGDNSSMPQGMAIEFRNVTPMNMLTMNRFVSHLIGGDIPKVDGKALLAMPWRDGGTVAPRKREDA